MNPTLTTEDKLCDLTMEDKKMCGLTMEDKKMCDLTRMVKDKMYVYLRQD